MLQALRKVVPLNLTVVLLLSGCGATVPAPVVERPQPPSQKIDYHIVSRDETLYSIAWRYELDFQRLARANGLPVPYTLMPGQRLTLDVSTVPAQTARARAIPTAEPLSSQPLSSRSLPTEPKAQSAPVTPSASPGPSTASRSSAPRPEPKPGPGAEQAMAAGEWSWEWPAKGKVTREYDASRVFKGINIATGEGATVKAAAPGVVVYAGSGLRGYGRLIIVKHSDRYLSAYAHNKRIFVGEQQLVKGGDRIAEAGGDPTDPARLYFEIREDGKPVDPMRLLPRQ